MPAAESRKKAWEDPLDQLERTRSLPVDRFVTFKVNQLSMAFERQWTRFMRERAGVSLSEWRILAMLREGPSTFARLVDVTGMNKALMSRSVQALQEQRLVAVAETPGDARSLTLALTDKGQRLLAQVHPLALRRQQHLLAVLSANERRVLYGAVDKLAAAALAWNEEP